eukprot:352687-Chlamydomonas_euryale.AAC.6
MTPAATAPTARPAASSAAARCAATSDAEHAVSTATAAPQRPSTNAARPGAADPDVEVKENGPTCVAEWAGTERGLLFHEPKWWWRGLLPGRGKGGGWGGVMWLLSCCSRRCSRRCQFDEVRQQANPCVCGGGGGAHPPTDAPLAKRLLLFKYGRKTASRSRRTSSLCNTPRTANSHTRRRATHRYLAPRTKPSTNTQPVVRAAAALVHRTSARPHVAAPAHPHVAAPAHAHVAAPAHAHVAALARPHVAAPARPHVAAPARPHVAATSTRCTTCPRTGTPARSLSAP